MWKKHKKELLCCTASAVGIIFFLLILVAIFEYLGIHVPGSREMWIGLIGAVIGGTFTLFGVLVTIYKQEESENEKKRIENMPILGFEVVFNDKEGLTVLTYTQGELITSGFSIFESKKYATILVRVVNNACAFNWTVEECVIKGELVKLGSAFNPGKERIVCGEQTSFNFDYGDINTSAFCLLRFSYEDIFGIKYYQDCPFTYQETTMIRGNEKIKRQIIEIRNVKQPILANEKAKMLLESARDYVDYQTFLKQ